MADETIGQYSELPRISIVTPSFNQGQFLEETIQSVLGQDYPNLEYIIIDGGSTDNSVEIIERYADRLAYWVSEPDEGQTDAINNGFRVATGKILAWLNSDDLYLPGTLHTIAQFFEEHADVDFTYGDVQIIDERGKMLLERKEIDFDYRILFYGLNLFAQPTCFFRKSVVDRIGSLNSELNYGMDVEFFLRAASNGMMFRHIPRFLAAFRLHSFSKTVSEQRKMTEEHRLARNLCRRTMPKYPLFDRFFISILQRVYRLKKCVKKALLRRQVDLYAFRRAKKRANSS